ncbi:ATP-dependent endonuclease [Pollutibacter soli]|uniref:ATP-dependent nuclease n=1 Tax=Pollutibacter soli TaxID=3034157 RepID=UPI003013713C
MKIFKIEITNYRLLRNFSVDLEDELSLVIGKNNTGKTSILSSLEKFLNQSEKNKFTFDDFNIVFKNSLKALINQADDLSEADYEVTHMSLKLFIEYTEADNLANVSRVMMDLDPENNVIVLGFEYLLDFVSYKNLKEDYRTFKAREAAKVAEDANYKPLDVFDFLKSNHHKYFRHSRKSYEFDKSTRLINEASFIDLLKEEISIKDIINFKFISARRDVTNKEYDKTLSGQTSKIYKKTEENEDRSQAVEKFKDTLTNTDVTLSTIYSSLFREIIDKVKSFGGIKKNDSDIEIISTLQHRELLEGNTTVVYRHDTDNQLPENYNGLGYMNLISMIFEIEILVHEFKREKERIPADINLLFIEEPEAHTHPQMQYVFIKNIKHLLKEGVVRSDGQSRNLQYIITTHSSHIVADSDFADIKYLKRENNDGVTARNLKDLRKEYDEETTQYQFLKQYLTISRAEIFFADKAILIEGDTERILIPTIMRKIDIEEQKRIKDAGETDPNLPLLSQNISIVEVGAYCHIFERFIDFLGIKTLIITDLDAVDGEGKKCEVSAGVSYSNEAISFFYGAVSLDDLKGYTLTNKCFDKAAGTWTTNSDGKVCVAYQTLEDGYNARSFEDGFIQINRDFIRPLKNDFKALQNRDDFDDPTIQSYALAANCIKKKTHFALDIIYHSDRIFSNWRIPSYIKEGLLWLKKD